MQMRANLFFFWFVFTLFAGAQTASFNTDLLHQLANPQYRLQSYNLLVRVRPGKMQMLKNQPGLEVLYTNKDLASIVCGGPALQQLSELGIISRAEYYPARKQCMNDTMRKRNRINAVHQGELPLPQAYDGTGVLLGFIDTGIDFNHRDFKDAQGNTRILYIWDQKPNSSSAPQPFNYGTEWTAAQINASLCTQSDAPYFGHGTHVAGIGGGNGLATGKHKGVAPKANLIMVSLDFNRPGPTIADGVKYIFDKALQLSLPCVINISVGDYYGSHDGLDFETQLIESEITAMSARAVIGAAGNAGSLRYHTKTQPQNNDTLFTWIRETGNTLYYWFYADTLQAQNLKISVGANRSNYTDLGNIGFKPWNYGLNTVKNDTLKFNNKRIGIVRTSASVDNYGVVQYQVVINADTLNLPWRIETTGQGLHHAWNFSFVSSNLPGTAQYPRMSKYLKPDTLYSMVSGFQCSEHVITVANYVNSYHYIDVQDSLRNGGEPTGEISAGSSLGPTRDERQKPDIAASGQMVMSAAVLSLLPGMLTNQPSQVARDSMHVIGGGTSAASPIVAGLAALYFQKNPAADHLMLKKAIHDCAYRDNFTGNALPDYQWGYGKLDGKNTLLCGDNLVSISKQNNLTGLSASPNPFHDEVIVQLPKSTAPKHLAVYNAMGQLVMDKNLSEDTITITEAELSGQTGLLLIVVTQGNSSYQFKAVRN